MGEDGNPIGIEIFKDPITDDGVKKSAKGLLVVHDVNGVLTLKDQATWEDVKSNDNQLRVIMLNGELHNQTTLTAIRQRLGI